MERLTKIGEKGGTKKYEKHKERLKRRKDLRKRKKEAEVYAEGQDTYWTRKAEKERKKLGQTKIKDINEEY